MRMKLTKWQWRIIYGTVFMLVLMVLFPPTGGVWYWYSYKFTPYKFILSISCRPKIQLLVFQCIAVVLLGLLLFLLAREGQEHPILRYIDRKLRRVTEAERAKRQAEAEAAQEQRQTEYKQKADTVKMKIKAIQNRLTPMIEALKTARSRAQAAEKRRADLDDAHSPEGKKLEILSRAVDDKKLNAEVEAAWEEAERIYEQLFGYRTSAPADQQILGGLEGERKAAYDEQTALAEQYPDLAQGESGQAPASEPSLAELRARPGGPTPIPRDREKWVIGQKYIAPDGKIGVWNGRRFDTDKAK